MGTDARVIDPDTLQEVPQGSTGEIVIHGPEVFQGYWKRARRDRGGCIHGTGRQAFFRSGDIGMVDEDGYFFLTDRLKRMINASGFKVWPAEVEALMYRHPAIAEACIISTPTATAANRSRPWWCCVPPTATWSLSRTLSTGAATTWPRTRCRAWCNLPTPAQERSG